MKLPVLSILAILLLLSLGCDPEYMSETAAEKEMKNIALAAKEFYIDYDRPPGSVEELVKAEYVKLNEKVHEQWVIDINWPDQMIAFSTSAHPKGEGLTVTYTIPQRY
mgnify:CR=1 FL=1